MDTPDLPPQPEQSAPVQAPRSRSAARINRAVTAIAVAVIAVLIWQSYDTREQLRDMREDLARRLADSDKNALEARALVKQEQVGLDSMQGKIGALEAGLQQAQGQYATLDTMYAEFSKARDDRALAEVEQAINIAAQQLELASNVPAALAALQNADSRLAQLDQTRFLGLRKLIALNIERLQPLSISDAGSVGLQLETIMGRIDSLPMGFEHQPPLLSKKSPGDARPKISARKNSKVAAASEPQAESSAPSPNLLAKLGMDIWNEFRQLVRIERLDRPDPALLAPSQAGYLRENLRLRLLSARLAMMQHNGKLFAEDIRQSRVLIQRYFDTESESVSTTLTELAQIEQVRLTLSLPNLEDTQAALRTLKLGHTNKH
jgi:uroporphyrin-III C-methyltransferase